MRGPNFYAARYICHYTGVPGEIVRSWTELLVWVKHYHREINHVEDIYA